MWAEPDRRRALAAAIAVAVLLAGSGCGAPSDEERVRGTLDTFAEATAKRDWRRICEEVLARRLLDRLRAAGSAARSRCRRVCRGFATRGWRSVR